MKALKFLGFMAFVFAFMLFWCFCLGNFSFPEYALPCATLITALAVLIYLIIFKVIDPEPKRGPPRKAASYSRRRRLPAH